MGYPVADPRHPRRVGYAAVGASAAAVVVLLVVFAGVLSPHPTHPIVYGAPLLYSQVAGPAAAAQAGRPGGPWTPTSFLGLGLGASYTGAGGLVSGCTIVWENNSTVVIPATRSSAAPGTEASWILASMNATGTVLLTAVSELSAAPVASNLVELRGSCTGTFDPLGPIPGSVVDSSTVANEANAAGGSTFLLRYSQSNQIVGLEGPYWSVTYTTCDLLTPAPGSTGTQFVALYNATDGTLFVNEGTGTTNC